ncbi:MAG: caspase family protein [Nitrospira sp.]|nr:caspase family protein [Nitrospira sp.]
MKSLGALVIGIGNYRLDPTVFPPLKYANKDATEVAKYLSICWGNPDDSNIILIDEDRATHEIVKEEFRQLEKDGPYQLLLVFLSGHGLSEQHNTGFVLQPAPNDQKHGLLDYSEFDQFLTSVHSKQTILILDCCYAEGIVKKLIFFSNLNESDTRLFIASSREHQETWEDDSVGHGIFTAHLLDLLNSGSSVSFDGVKEQLDVDSELFPVLCEQVPLYVFLHKNQKQEPVKGGASCRAVKLPVARFKRRFKERSVFNTALRRTRQILLSLGLGVFTLLVLIYSFVYHAEIDKAGKVQIRHGTKWLAPLFQLLPGVILDTGIKSSELSSDPVQRYQVQAGWITGVWTHVSERGYRNWYDKFHDSLDPFHQSYYDVLISAGERNTHLKLDEESTSSEVAFAAWTLLDNPELTQIDAVLNHIIGSDRIAPLISQFNPNELDFGILDLTPNQISNYADALRYLAIVDPDKAFKAYIGYLKACSMWMYYSSDERYGKAAKQEVREKVADVLNTIGIVRKDKGELSILSNEMLDVLKKLADSGYSGLINYALDKVIVDRKANVMQEALSKFRGNIFAPDQEQAFNQIKDLLDDSIVSQKVVEEVYNLFIEAGFSESVYTTSLLIAAAQRRGLPKPILDILLENANKIIASGDISFISGEYARILAYAMSQIPKESHETIYRLIDQVTRNLHQRSSGLAEIYFALAEQGLETKAMVQHILNQAKLAPPFQPHAPDTVVESQPGITIMVGYGPWLKALADLGTQRPLSADAINVLESRASDPALNETIVRALSAQTKWSEIQCWENNCSKFLMEFARDSSMRELATNVLAANLARLPYVEFQKALKALNDERVEENEVEIRVSLGLIRVNSQLSRIRHQRFVQ